MLLNETEIFILIAVLHHSYTPSLLNLFTTADGLAMTPYQQFHISFLTMIDRKAFVALLIKR